MNKIFVACAVVIVVVIGIWAYAAYAPTSNPNSSNAAGGTIPAQGSEPGDAGPKMTLTGTLTCLPHKGDGPHTLECAYGLKSDDGKYYALQNLWEVAPGLTNTGVRVQIVGNVSTPPTNEQYDIVGVVAVQSAQKI